MKCLVAVSGGIDSVVLLDMLVAEGDHELTVAHFDHGIRQDSAADARFVEALANHYGLPFVGRREELGAEASEELARERRYGFLRAEAGKREAVIVTAHHADDAIETIALNLTRGTGWRGMAVLDTSGIIRPLLPYSKQQLREYALKMRLEWVEDSTNASDAYLRNRLRRRISSQLAAHNRQAILELWKRQVELKRAIDAEAYRLLADQKGEYSRYFFTHIPACVATELLRALLLDEAGQGATRPQLERVLLAVKTARQGAKFSIGGAWLVFAQKTFRVAVKTP